MAKEKPMDSDIKALLVMTFEHMRDFQVVLDESVIVHTALHRAMCETVPGFDAVYGKFYRDLQAGPIGRTNREKLAAIDELISGLKNLPEE